MAGGMVPGRSGRSLGERAARSGVGPPDPPSAPPPATDQRRVGSRGRHCWVHDPPGAPGVWPGLLVEWRQDEDGGWHGRVSYAVAGPGDVVLVEAWVPAALLEQR
ncbi:hypothetical protein [Geodermatophilus pulveris]|uniref:hypothetical protein n=1 Tax=Geodermatophilus pulveris TaxID=1564159 RepID=UPI001FE85846|nr:hypothetical protein [Geodermatophilus pulveris]